MKMRRERVEGRKRQERRKAWKGKGESGRESEESGVTENKGQTFRTS